MRACGDLRGSCHAEVETCVPVSAGTPEPLSHISACAESTRSSDVAGTDRVAALRLEEQHGGVAAGSGMEQSVEWAACWCGAAGAGVSSAPWGGEAPFPGGPRSATGRI